MGGGLIQLVAFGAQDAFLSGNPQITFWKVLYKRHSNFSMEAMRVNFTGAPQYGQRVVAIVNRNADLMYKTYLEVVLPDTDASGVAVLWNGDNTRRLGYTLIKQVEIEIGGQIIDRHYGEWLYIWENLTSCYDNSVKLDSMLGGNLRGMQSASANCGGRPNVLYIPLQFWFCRNPGLALPLIALQYHEVRINLTLQNPEFLVSAKSGMTIMQAAALLPRIPEMSIYIDYVYLDVEERRRFAQQQHEYLIDQLQYGLPQTLTTPSARIDLTLNHPVKELIWVFQDEDHIDCQAPTTPLGPLPGAATGWMQPFRYDDIVNRCRLQMNGTDRFDERYGDYFWKVQPYQHHSGGGFWPTRNESTTTTATTGIQVCQFTLDATTSATHTASNVSGTILVGMTITGAGITTPLTITNLAGLVITTTSFTATATVYTGILDTSATAIETIGSDYPVYSSQNPINVYSFALKPEEHQPSGTCNFSRIDTATLVFDSIGMNGVVGSGANTAARKPTKTTPFIFRIYAVNYNVFRVMSGMGGLAYSN